MDPKNLGVDPKVWAKMNWFEKVMEIILERFERIGTGVRIKETAAQRVVKRHEFEMLVKAGEEHPEAVIEQRFGTKLNLRETADQAAVRRQEFELLMKAGEAQRWAVLENLMGGHRVTDPRGNAAWLNETLKFYEKEGDKEKNQHYEIIGEYDKYGIPTGRAQVYRINGPRELRKMRARGG